MASPQELAAYVAGSFGIISMVVSTVTARRATANQRLHEENLVTLKGQIERDLTTFKDNLPKTEARNRRLFELQVLLHNTCISFDRLAIMSKTIDHEKMLEETANTLSSYARFQTFFGSPDCFDFPLTIRDSVNSTKTCFAYVFLLLQDNKQAGGTPRASSALDEAVRIMKEWNTTVEKNIREIVGCETPPT